LSSDDESPFNTVRLFLPPQLEPAASTAMITTAHEQAATDAEREARNVFTMASSLSKNRLDRSGACPATGLLILLCSGGLSLATVAHGRAAVKYAAIPWFGCQ
jgi:hypothetical protein